jgi:hypothetical protein
MLLDACAHELQAQAQRPLAWRMFVAVCREVLKMYGSSIAVGKAISRKTQQTEMATHADFMDTTPHDELRGRSASCDRIHILRSSETPRTGARR